MLVTLAGSAALVRLVDSNANDPMLVTPLLMMRLARLSPPNASYAMLVTLPGMVTLASPQPENALVPMPVTPLLMMRLVRLEQPSNSSAPMPVALPAKTMTLAKTGQLIKGWRPTLQPGRVTLASLEQ